MMSCANRAREKQFCGIQTDGSDGGEGAEIMRICACECYYQVLGVSKDADDTALKKAYQKPALKLHPDKCSLIGADEAFKKVPSTQRSFLEEIL